MSFKIDEALDPSHENALIAWAEKVATPYFDSFEEKDSNDGLRVELDAIFNWVYQVKVKRPWSLMGKETLEIHGIWETDQSFPIISGLAATELVDVSLGFPLLWLARDIQAHSWDYDLVGCADNKWAKPMRDEDGYGPDYRELDLNEEFWHEDPIPIAHGDKVSLSILGFEGEESDLASVSRWNVMFLDGYSGEADPELNTINIVKEPTLLLNGEIIPKEQVNSVLLRAGELLNARPIF